MPNVIHKKRRLWKSYTKPWRRNPSRSRFAPPHWSESPSRIDQRKKRDDAAEREVSAGGIVFRRTPQGPQVAVMRDSYGKWAFPKGHVESGEQLEETAARETLEELGLDQVRLWQYLGKIDIWFRDRYHKKGTLIHKDIHYFLFEALEGAELHPRPEEHVYEAKWVSLKRLLSASSYPDMVPILKRALLSLEEFI